MGNRATIATLAAAGVRVTSPTEKVEREAATVADAVMRTPASAPASVPVMPVAPVEEVEADHQPARELVAARLASAAGVHAAERHSVLPHPDLRIARSPRPGFRQTPLPASPTGSGRSGAELRRPPAVTLAREVSPAMPRGPPSGLPSVIATGFSGGTPVAPRVRDRIEPVLGADLSGMRVHTGPAAAQAATSVGARAFTVGSDVVLGSGERADDVALMAHEATHVVQQTGGAARLVLARDEAADTTDDSWIPDAVLDQIRATVRAIPGYGLVAAAIGQDPLTGQPATLNLDDTVETLLLAGPFGPGVSIVLKAMDLLSSAWSVVSTTLASHNITVARIKQDIAAAWDELSVSNGIEGNVAIVRRYIQAFLADIRAAVSALVDQLIAAVRAAIVPVVEPYLVEGALAPTWNLAVKVLHYNPLTGADVNATTAEIIADFLTLIGKPDVLAQMTERGTLQQTADWVDAQIATFLGLIGRAGKLFSDAWDAISPANLPNLLDTLPDLAGRAVALFSDVVAFGGSLIQQVLVFVRDSLLNWLSEKAHTMRGFKLLTVILGRNPFTGAGVDRSAENLIGGFIELIAGPDTYAQLAESGVIAEAAGRIESEMARLNISWELITGTFKAVWESLSLADFLDPIGAIQRVIDQFGEPLSRIISFAATVVQVVLELILRLMNFPGDLLGSIIAGVQQALDNIQADPVGFLNNLLAALKQGFSQFFDNIIPHMLQGLADWLFRGLKGMGIQIPTELSGASILQLALDVMGLSVEFLWECLGEVIGPEKVALVRGAIDRLGQAWAFITDVQARGMAAIWDYVSTQLGNLWDTIITMAKDWLVSNIIDAAVAKVLSMLDPTGVMAVVNSCIAFYRAVQSVIEYVTEILQIVKTYVDTVVAIAAGNIAPGAAMLEQGLANAIPVAIGFLASQVGLGNIPEKIVEIINGLRQAIKDAVIWLIRKAVQLGQAALDALGLGGERDEQSEPEGGAAAGLSLPNTRTAVNMDGAGHSLWFEKAGGSYQIYMASQAGHLITRIELALRQPNLPDGMDATLNTAINEIRLLEQDIADSDRGYANGERTLNSPPLGGGAFTEPEYRQAVTQKLLVYRTMLETLGTLHHMKDLTDLGHRSRYVTENSIMPTYRGYPLWRDTFYGGWRPGVREKLKKDSFTTALQYWQSLNPGVPPPASFDLYLCAECKVYHSDRGAVPGFDVRTWTLDHRRSVVSHFKSEGVSMVQADRENWYNLESNLQPMCDQENYETEKVTDWTVHRRFRGPGDAGPDPSDES